MKKITLVLICLSLLFSLQVVEGGYYYARGSAVSGNDFSSDANCVALWRFENGALTTDSKGGNTLTDHGTVGTSTTDYKEGSASADFIQGGDYFSITDADLDAGFPFRAGDGTPGDDISLCFWMKPDVLDSNDYIFSKYDVGLNKRTFAALIVSSNIFSISIGYNNGDAGQAHSFGTAMATDKWYHVGITFQNASANASSIRIRIWDDNAGALLGADYTTSSAKTINIEDAVLCIADREGDADRVYDGHKDELVIFKDILSVAEIDKIRAGIYP